MGIVLIKGLILLIELILSAILIRYEWKKKSKRGLLGAVIGTLGIIYLIVTIDITWDDIGYIPKCFAIEYHNGSYNEGYYYGGWHNGLPQGRGTLTYAFFGDGCYYSISEGSLEYKAISYTGEFDKGYRAGEGVVIYEGGFREEGTFYGAWSEGRKVFEGKRWLTNETENKYREGELYAASTRDGYYIWNTDWISVEQ